MQPRERGLFRARTSIPGVGHDRPTADNRRRERRGAVQDHGSLTRLERHQFCLKQLSCDTERELAFGVGAAGEVDALVEAEVFARAGRLEFVHPLVRSSVYESIPPAQRALAHGRAARLIREQNCERAAAHLLKTDPSADAGAVETLRQAAQLALGRGAPELACVHLRRALSEPPDAPSVAVVLRALGTAELVAREPAAIDRLSQALHVSLESVDRAEIALLLGEALINAGRAGDAELTFDAAVAQLGDRDRQLLLRLETSRVSLGVLDQRFMAGLKRRLPQLRAEAERGGRAGRALLVLLAFCAAMDGARRADIVDLVDRGLDDGRLIADETADGLPMPMATRLLSWIDELERADRLHAEMLADARRRGSIAAFAGASVCAASTALRRGALPTAEAEARTALELVAQHQLRFYEPFARAFLGEALLERGQLDEAAAILEGIDLGPMRGTAPIGIVLYARGRLRAARGDSHGAASDLRQCGHVLETNSLRNPNISPWRTALALVLTDEQEAHTLIEAELSRAREVGQPRAVGVALRALALLSDPADRVVVLQEATETLGHSPSALELARTLTDYGVALSRRGHRASALDPLRRGLDLADRCGADPLARRATEELRAAGARPRRRRLSGIEALTVSERRVTDLAAEGLTNRQIAQALFVTTKRIGTHLGHIYDKLGTNNRDDLARIVRTAKQRTSSSNETDTPPTTG